jgi:hypothetical protein
MSIAIFLLLALLTAYRVAEHNRFTHVNNF